MAVNQQQLDYLSAMGVPVWVSRDLPMPETPVAEFVAESEALAVPKQLLDNPESQLKPSPQGLKSADALIRDLQETTVSQIADLAASLDEPAEIAKPIVTKNLDGVNWIELEREVSQCTACDLHSKREQTVFGRGHQQASLMVVGDIPRLTDEQQQRPFSGEAGELLDGMLKHLVVEADDIYFTNLLKCRPPLDSSPQSNQAASCLSYLKQQIKLVKPDIVLLLGRHSAQQTLGKFEPMSKLRQEVHTLDGVTARFIASYHPAYLIEQPRLKALVWQDLQFINQTLKHHG